MKLGRISGVAVFVGAALGGAVVAQPGAALAASVFRQYSPQMCIFTGPPSANHQYFGGPANLDVYDPAQPISLTNVPSTEIDCPIVEDESVHRKGGATVHFVISEHAENHKTQYQVCKTFEASVGGACNQAFFTTGTEGVHAYAATPGAFWVSSTDFGDLSINLGAKGAGAAPNVIQGYWVSN